MINSRLMLTHRLDSDSTVVYYLALNSLSSKSLLLFIVFHVQFTLSQGPLQTWPFPFSDYINEFHLKHFLIGCCIRTPPPHAVTWVVGIGGFWRSWPWAPIFWYFLTIIILLPFFLAFSHSKTFRSSFNTISHNF